MNTESKDQKIREKYIELEVLESQIQDINKQIQKIDQQIGVLILIKYNLDELKNFKSGVNTFSSFGLGIYLPTTLQALDELLVGVGANVYVPKTIIATKNLVDQQIEELKEYANNLEIDIEEFNRKNIQLRKEMQNLAST